MGEAEAFCLVRKGKTFIRKFVSLNPCNVYKLKKFLDIFLNKEDISSVTMKILSFTKAVILQFLLSYDDIISHGLLWCQL